MLGKLARATQLTRGSITMMKTWQLRALALYLGVGAPVATSCAKESSPADRGHDGQTGGKTGSAGANGKAGSTGTSGSTSSFGGTTSTGGTPGGGKGGSAGGMAEGGDDAGGAGRGGDGAGGINMIPPDLVERASAVVHYMCSATAESTNQVQMSLRLENKSSDPLPMANVTIRYWLTAEAPPELHQYYVHASLLSPKAEFISDGPNSHVVLSFGGGNVAPHNMLSDAEVQLAAANNTTKLDQTNDFSFEPSSTTFKPNAKITLYLADKLIWGCEPSGACSGDDTGAGGAGGAGGVGGVGGESSGGAPATDGGGAASPDAGAGAGGSP